MDTIVSRRRFCKCGTVAGGDGGIVSGSDETCTPTAVTDPVTDCTTGYIPGDANNPSTTCPSGCTQVTAVAGTTASGDGACTSLISQTPPGYIINETSLMRSNFNVTVTCDTGYTPDNPLATICPSDNTAYGLSGCSPAPAGQGDAVTPVTPVTPVTFPAGTEWHVGLQSGETCNQTCHNAGVDQVAVGNAISAALATSPAPADVDAAVAAAVAGVPSSLTCNDGNWGVADEASLLAAGQSYIDSYPNNLSVLQGVADISASCPQTGPINQYMPTAVLAPFISPTNTCVYNHPTFLESVCDGADASNPNATASEYAAMSAQGYRRLCQCTTV